MAQCHFTPLLTGRNHWILLDITLKFGGVSHLRLTDEVLLCATCFFFFLSFSEVYWSFVIFLFPWCQTSSLCTDFTDFLPLPYFSSSIALFLLFAFFNLFQSFSLPFLASFCNLMGVSQAFLLNPHHCVSYRAIWGNGSDSVCLFYVFVYVVCIYLHRIITCHLYSPNSHSISLICLLLIIICFSISRLLKIIMLHIGDLTIQFLSSRHISKTKSTLSDFLN